MNRHPLIAPGDYPLTLMIDDATTAGVLTLPDTGPVTAMTYTMVLSTPPAWQAAAMQIGPSPAAWVPDIHPYGPIRGKLYDGADVMLLDASLALLVPKRVMVIAALAVVGFRLWTTEGFDTLTFQVGGLTELSGVSPLQTFDVPDHTTPGARFGVTWNADSAQEWTAANGDTVGLHYDIETAPRQLYNMWLTTMPVVTVSGTSRSVQDWMTTYVRPIAELAAFATGHPQSISVVTVSHGVHSAGSVYGTGLNQKKYGAEQPQPGTMQSLLHCGPGGAPLPDLLRGWTELKDRYTTFADYFISISAAALPVTSKFIALVAALESFHSTNDPAGGDLTLWQRLQELAEQLPAEIREPIERAVNPLPVALRGIMSNPINVWHVMGKARNNLAHGNNNRQSDDQLAMLTRLGHTVAVALALITFGVPTARLAAAIQNHTWPLP